MFTEVKMHRLTVADRPLIRLRDQRVLVDADLLRITRRRDLPPHTAMDALAAALTGNANAADSDVLEVSATGWVARRYGRLTG